MMSKNSKKKRSSPEDLHLRRFHCVVDEDVNLPGDKKILESLILWQ